MTKTETRNMGIAVEMPKQSCSDVKCPFHGKLSTRGRQFIGTVLSTKMRKTAIIEFGRLHYLKKYERYEKRRTKLKVHNPECINAKEGDLVKLMECRPLRKTKNFVIIQKLGVQKGFMGKMEARESAKIIAKKEEVVKTEEEK